MNEVPPKQNNEEAPLIVEAWGIKVPVRRGEADAEAKTFKEVCLRVARRLGKMADMTLGLGLLEKGLEAVGAILGSTKASFEEKRERANDVADKSETIAQDQALARTKSTMSASGDAALDDLRAVFENLKVLGLDPKIVPLPNGQYAVLAVPSVNHEIALHLIQQFANDPMKKIDTDDAVLHPPYHVEASEIHLPGAVAAQVHSAGAVASQIHSDALQESQEWPTSAMRSGAEAERVAEAASVAARERTAGAILKEARKEKESRPTTRLSSMGTPLGARGLASKANANTAKTRVDTVADAELEAAIEDEELHQAIDMDIAQEEADEAEAVRGALESEASLPAASVMFDSKIASPLGALDTKDSMPDHHLLAKGAAELAQAQQQEELERVAKAEESTR